MSTNYAFDNMTLKILIVSRLSFISFFRHSLIAILNDFIFYINNIRLAKIIIFIILNFSRTAVYEARRCSNVSENSKSYWFTYKITLHAMLKLVSFHSIEDISKSLSQIRSTWNLSMKMQSKFSMIFCSKFCIFLSFVNLIL